MTDHAKRTINAKLILKDIQAGVDESEIKRKYKLTDKGYQSVFQKLSAMGLLKESDHHFGCPRQSKNLSGPNVKSLLPGGVPRVARLKPEFTKNARTAVL